MRGPLRKRGHRIDLLAVLGLAGLALMMNKFYLRGDKTLAELAKLHDVHPNQITDWKNQLLKGAANVFGAETAEPTIDLKELHAKIGQQSLEIDFLSGALTRVGLLSAKR